MSDNLFKHHCIIWDPSTPHYHASNIRTFTVMLPWRAGAHFTDHYNDVIMSTMASQITNLMIVYSSVYSGQDQRKHQCSTSLAFVRGIHRWPVNSPHKEPVTRKMFPCDDAIMRFSIVIQKRWEFQPALMQIVRKQSLWNFAHGTPAKLSWHVQNFVAKWCPTIELH